MISLHVHIHNLNIIYSSRKALRVAFRPITMGHWTGDSASVYGRGPHAGQRGSQAEVNALNKFSPLQRDKWKRNERT